MSVRTRYAVVGLGSRSRMFTTALLKDYADTSELVAFCDVNQTRMDYYNHYYASTLAAPPVPTYKPDQFDEMVRDQRVDCVIVTSIDRTHHRYIIRAMELGCDVISEKPMTMTAPRCQDILDTIKATGRQLRVTFNYRYAPRNSKVKEVLQSGAIGAVRSVHFEWLLDTVHGADYFRRWHRDKRNSGGLMVHKATHHFDLVNWWLGSQPETVYAMGDLLFYGRENAEERGATAFYDRAHGRPVAERDPFAIRLESDEALRRMYLEAEAEDGYVRDQSVFGDGISIEDDMAVLVRYRSRAQMSYHLTAYAPWEGFRVAFNGTKGRLEYDVHENSYVSGSSDDSNLPEIRDSPSTELSETASLVIRPLWGRPVEVELGDSSEAGHGGGDRRMLDDIFKGVQSDPLGRAANHVDGAMSILTGIAANQAFATGLPVRVGDLVRF
ncbi:Gfo/Idh/MocA family oxidoreductase [Chloroflexia bacterium SDU3-3]|nr:Gfo/Idh/MocA family oxidoreductase [Chloroflexia bacterium SDU3-3]